MSSLRRIAASRANGARSRGPVTPEGKAASSRNAFRHGLLANQVLLEMEEPSNFEALFDIHVRRFEPLDDVEMALIEEMASAYWRMRRAWAIETALLNERLETHNQPRQVDRLAAAFQDLAATPSLALLHRYEGRLHRMYQRAIRTLLLLRESPPECDLPNEPSPISGHLGLPTGAPPPVDSASVAAPGAPAEAVDCRGLGVAPGQCIGPESASPQPTPRRNPACENSIRGQQGARRALPPSADHDCSRDAPALGPHDRSRPWVFPGDL